MRDEQLLEVLSDLIQDHRTYEARLVARGRAFVAAYGLVVPRSTGQPWSKRLRTNATESVLKGEDAARIADSCEREIIHARDGYFRDGDNTGDDPAASFAHVSCVIRVSTGIDWPAWVGVYCIAERRSTSGFTPAGLRALLHRAQFTVRNSAVEMPPARLFAEAAAAVFPLPAVRYFLKTPDCHAAILWSYDSDRREFHAVTMTGVKGQSKPKAVPLARPGTSVRFGLLSMLRPELPYISYDAKDLHNWRPAAMRRDWGPRDRKTWTENQWQSMVAVPILAGGFLVGALSLYSRAGARSLIPTAESSLMIQFAATMQGLLRSIDEDTRLEVTERLFANELSKATTTLSVVGHIHDLAKYARTTSVSFGTALDNLRMGNPIAAKLELEEASAAVNSLLRQADHLRRMAKASSSGRQVIDVAEVVEELHYFLGMQVKDIGGDRSTLIVHAPRVEGLNSRVMADKLKLERIVLNLVDNAAYWAKRGSPTPVVKVTVEPVAGSASDKGVRLVVEDNGPGVDKAIAPDIWNRFFTTRRGEEGTGLGLWLVKMFVGEMNGHAYLAHSEPGQTRFVVSFPSVAQGKVS